MITYDTNHAVNRALERRQRKGFGRAIASAAVGAALVAGALHIGKSLAKPEHPQTPTPSVRALEIGPYADGGQATRLASELAQRGYATLRVVTPHEGANVYVRADSFEQERRIQEDLTLSYERMLPSCSFRANNASPLPDCSDRITPGTLNADLQFAPQPFAQYLADMVNLVATDVAKKPREIVAHELCDYLEPIRQVESSGGKHVVSAAGAKGDFQVMPGTAYDAENRWRAKDEVFASFRERVGSYTPRQLSFEQHGRLQANRWLNGQDSVTTLFRYYRAFDGDITRTLAAYNGGPGNVDRYASIPETRRYVAKVQREHERLQRR